MCCNVMHADNTNRGITVPDVRRDGSFVSATPQVDSTAGRDFPSACHAAASLPIGAEPKSGDLRLARLLLHTSKEKRALTICSVCVSCRSQFQQAHKRK